MTQNRNLSFLADLLTTSGVVNITGGGTGQTTASAGFNALSPITTTGDLIVGNATNSATRLPIGTNGTVLQSNGTTATWATLSTGVTSVSFGSTGLTPNTATTGAVTVAGTLVVGNGGTGLSTTPTNGQLLIGNGTNYTLSTLTAGTGITITNTSGAISIAASSSGGAQGFVTQFTGHSTPPTLQSQGFGII